MKVNKIISIIVIYTVLPSVLLAQKKIVEKINWTIAAKLPRAPGLEKQLGLAGVFAGLSNNVLLVAGGAYFPDKKPWEGGQKAHTAQVFVLKKDKADRFSWITSALSLKSKKAYGASTTVADGVVCAGGETETANSSRDAFLMKWDAAKSSVICHDLPPLPIPLANACMAAIGEKVYLIGGESNGKPSSKAFILNLSNTHLHWEVLPDMPLAMSHSVAVAQSNGKHACIYVIGGRSSTAAGISQLHDKANCYDPLVKKWVILSNISDGINTTNLSAATGVAVGKNQILIIGGDKGNIFHQIEIYNSEIEKAKTATHKQKLQAAKLQIVTHHPGFSRDVLVYNTITNKWAAAGQLPSFGHVTTTALMWDNDIFIPAGEIMPGIRTPDILRGEILHDFK